MKVTTLSSIELSITCGNKRIQIELSYFDGRKRLVNKLKINSIFIIDSGIENVHK